MTKNGWGTFCVFVSAVLYSIGGVCMKMIPWHGMSINAGRSFIAMFVVGTFMVLTKHKLRFNRWILVGALSVFLTNALFCIANKLTTSANAIVLQFTAPIFVIVFGLLLFKKKPDKLDLIMSAVVFGGIVFFFLDSLDMGGGLGNFLALLSGITYSGVFMMNDLPDSDPMSCVIFGYIFSVISGIPFMAQETNFESSAMISLLVLGMMQLGLGHVLLCIGLKTTPPVMASLVSGIEPVLNPIWVSLFFEEEIGKYAMIGTVIVIGGVLTYNVLKAKASDKAKSEK